MGMRKICLLIWALGLSLVGVQAQAKGKKKKEIKKNVVKNRLVEKVKEPKFNTILANYGRGGGWNQGRRRGGFNQGGRGRLNCSACRQQVWCAGSGGFCGACPRNAFQKEGEEDSSIAVELTTNTIAASVTT